MRNIFAILLKPKNIWAKLFIAILIIGLLVAGIAGLLDPIKDFLSSEIFSFTIGKYNFSALKIIEGIILVVLMVWLANLASDMGEKYFRRIKKMNASNRSLVIKSFQIFVYFLFFMMTMGILGIDLTTLAVFSGALGIGIGVGLQKISSNFVSGFILLFDKAVEEGDLVEIGTDVTGYVRETKGRFTLVETFDGQEIMIPNEDFITSRVVNWTYSNTQGRITVEVRVSYDSDIELAYKLMLDAAKEHPRCISTPEPECFLRKFGDHSVDFVLYFWIEDVIRGRYGPQSDVMFSIWRKFKQNGIKIPFQQHDIHVKEPIQLIQKESGKK